MGAFAGVLGRAAGGFEEAHQADLQRQFLSEQGSRQAGLDIFKTIALDPNQPGHIRDAAMQGYLGIVNTPYGKFKLEKATAPIQQMMADWRAQQAMGKTQPPPPPMTTQVPGIQAGGPPQISVGSPIPLPPGVAGPQQQGPPQMAGGQLNLPPMQAHVQGPPPPPQDFYLAGVPQYAAAQATMAGAPIHGQMQARREEFSQIPGFSEESPLTKGVLEAGGNPAFLARNQGMGQSMPGSELIRLGLAQAGEVDPATTYNVRQMFGGNYTFTPTAGKGQVVSNGQLIDQDVAAGKRTEATQQARLPYDLKKIGVRFGNSLALQENQARLGIQSGNLKQTDQIYMKNWADLRQRENALNLMQQNLKEAEAGNQQAMASLLFNHIGMLNAIPGRSTVSRAQVEEAEETTPYIKGIIAKWFHQDENGDYLFDGYKGGINLTKPQMEQMVSLAQNRVTAQQQMLRGMSTLPGMFGSGEAAPPGVSAVGGYGGLAGEGKKAKGGGPPKPPQSGPQVGAVEDGYRFKGGDPSNKANWEPVTH